MSASASTECKDAMVPEELQGEDTPQKISKKSNKKKFLRKSPCTEDHCSVGNGTCSNYHRRCNLGENCPYATTADCKFHHPKKDIVCVYTGIPCQGESCPYKHRARILHFTNLCSIGNSLNIIEYNRGVMDTLLQDLLAQKRMEWKQNKVPSMMLLCKFSLENQRELYVDTYLLKYIIEMGIETEPPFLTETEIMEFFKEHDFDYVEHMYDYSEYMGKE
jgi:hypothetical protein